MQPRRLNIHCFWNHLTAVAAFILTALVNVAAAEPSGETRLSCSHAKQLEAVAGLVREALAGSAAKLDGDGGDDIPQPVLPPTRPALHQAATLLSPFPAETHGFRAGGLALRSGLTRAPPST